MRRRCAALGLLAALTLGACTPGASSDPTVTPAPSPTFTCTAPAIQGPCTAEKAAEEKKQAADVAAASSSFTNFVAEINRVGRAGGTVEATPAMARYAGGPFLKSYVGFEKELKSSGGLASGGVRLTKMTFLAGERRSGAPTGELTFSFCLDATQNTLYDSHGKSVGTGGIAAGKAYFRDSGGWKIWDSNDSEVERCPKS